MGAMEGAAGRKLAVHPPSIAPDGGSITQGRAVAFYLKPSQGEPTKSTTIALIGGWRGMREAAGSVTSQRPIIIK